MATFKLALDDWRGAAKNSLVQGLNEHRLSGTLIGHQADDVAGQSRQDVVFRQHKANGQYLGAITVKNGGHGSSTGLEDYDANTVRCWFGHDGLGTSGYVQWDIGQTGVKSFVPMDLPEGDIELDNENNRLVVRNNDSRRNADRYRIYDFATVKANDRKLISEFYVPHWGNRWQGMFICEGRLFVHRDVKTKGASRAQMFDLNGKLLDWWDTTNMGDEAEGFFAKKVGDTEVIYAVKRTGPLGAKRIIEGTSLITLPKKSEPWDGKSFPGAEAFSIGSRHPAVTLLGKRLEAHGWTGYKNGPGIPMSETDKAGVKWWQEKQGWSGSGADGVPGRLTWSTLMETPKPVVDPKPDPTPEEPLVPKLPSYYPEADRKSQWYPNIAGGATFTKVDKLVIHTTEGSGWHNYGTSGFGPHMTWNGEWRQHIPLTKSATALTDPSSTPVRENRDNVIQIELVGFAKNSGNMPDNTIEALAQFIAWLHKYGLPLNIMEKWTGPNTTARLSSSEYDAFKGVLGHQHVSGNDHWDPGQIPWNVIIDRAREIVSGVSKPVEPTTPSTPAEPSTPVDSDGVKEEDLTKFPGADAFKIGSNHPAVTLLGQRLVAHGWRGYKSGPGVPMGVADKKGTQWFQGLQGWDGDGADGVPGKLTWEALLKAPKPQLTFPLGGDPIFGRVTTGFKAKGGWAWSQGHPGEDWNGPDPDYGNPVFAVRSGIVKYIGRLPWDQKIGNSFGDRALVIQDDAGTYQTLYAHMSKVVVRVGQRVQVGDKVGELGFSGNVIPANKQGTHLHVERRKAPYRYGTDVVKPVYGD